MTSHSSDLVDLVEHLLSMRDHQTTSELARGLGRRGHVFEVAEVEKVLRRNPDRFKADRAFQRRWHLRPQRRRVIDAPVDRTRRSRQLIDRLPPLYAWQQESLAVWQAAGRHGVIEAVTGAGKTLLGVKATLDAAASGRPALVLVPTTPLLQQWRERLWEAMPGVRVGLLGAGDTDEPGHQDVVVATVQSATRRRNSLTPVRGGLLVGDEAHRYGAATFSRALLDGYDWRLGLTATYQRGDDANDDILDPYFGGVRFRLGYERALREEVVAPFTVELRGVRLDPVSNAIYQENVEVASRARRRLVHQFGLPVEPFATFFMAVVRISKGTDGPAAATARAYLKAFKEYRTALAESPAKLDALVTLSDAIRASTGTLIFTESIASCEAAARTVRQQGISARAIHSELDHDDRNVLLHRFGGRRIDCLAAPRVLDEGIDVPEADLAIIVAASSSRRQMIQRMGRVIRRKPEARHAHFILLYARGTREDPAEGAHETFLEEILPVAQEVEHG